jgi:hypothetical protein
MPSYSNNGLEESGYWYVKKWHTAVSSHESQDGLLQENHIVTNMTEHWSDGLINSPQTAQLVRHQTSNSVGPVWTIKFLSLQCHVWGVKLIPKTDRSKCESKVDVFTVRVHYRDINMPLTLIQRMRNMLF